MVVNMGCSHCINNAIIKVIHLLLLLIGVGMMVISCIALAKCVDFTDILEDGAFVAPIMLLLNGFILLWLMFGTRKGKSSVNLYILSIIFVILAGISVVVVFYNEGFIEDGMQEAFDKYDNPNETDFTNALDKQQNKLKCCGVYGPEDWKNATYMNSFSVADGCCKTVKEGCGYDYFNHANATDIYEDGCYQVFEQKFLGIGPGMIGLVLAASVVLLIMCRMPSKSTDSLASKDLITSIEKPAESAAETESQKESSHYSNQGVVISEPLTTGTRQESHRIQQETNSGLTSVPIHSTDSAATNSNNVDIMNTNPSPYSPYSSTSQTPVPYVMPGSNTSSYLPALGFNSPTPPAPPSFAPPPYNPNPSYPIDSTQFTNPTYPINPHSASPPMYPLSPLALSSGTYPPSNATPSYTASAPPANIS